MQSCDGTTLVAGHILAKGKGKLFFILPICSSCNQSTKEGWNHVKKGRRAVKEAVAENLTQEDSD